LSGYRRWLRLRGGDGRRNCRNRRAREQQRRSGCPTLLKKVHRPTAGALETRTSHGFSNRFSVKDEL